MIEDIVKIVFSIIAGGLVGMERENVHRPAGFRTHILVCVGSCLVMMTSKFIFDYYYNSNTNVDIARLGAQVISGIGFLGAGTIIKDGPTVKGLTTAATLWAVSCIGLAIGIGYYKGAFMALVAVYLTLIVLKKIEVRFFTKGIIKDLEIEGRNLRGCIQKLDSILSLHSATIKSVKFLLHDQDDIDRIFYQVFIPQDININQLITDIYLVEGVMKISLE